MKTIYLARHAKSSWKAGASDFGRPLSIRGETDAMKIAQKMIELSWFPQKIVSSPATRAKLTTNVYTEIIKYPEDDVQWDEDIYAACTITLLHLLSTLDEDTESIMLVGHNPAIEDLLVHLCGYKQVDQIKQDDGKVFTTSNVAKLTIDTEWKDIIMNELRLDKILRPKEI